MASLSLICYNNSNMFRSSFTPRHQRSWKNISAIATMIKLHSGCMASHVVSSQMLPNMATIATRW